MKPTSFQNGMSFAVYVYCNTSQKLTYTMFPGRLLKSIICLVLKTFLHFQCDNVKYYSYDNCL